MPDKDKDIILEDNPEIGTKKDTQEEENEIPKYKSRIELGDTDKKRIKERFFKEFEEIKNERDESGVEDKWDEEDLVYRRISPDADDEEAQFDAHIGLTKSAVDTVVNRIMEALMESDPKFAFSPRPEYENEGGREVTDKQTDFIDYAIDDVIPYREAKEQQVRSAVKHGNGILKWCHKIIRKPRKREEVYQGDPKFFMVGPKGKKELTQEEAVRLQEEAAQDGVKLNIKYQNKGLAEFIKAYPNAQEDYPGYVKKLAEGKKINIVASYKETVYNDPLPKFVELKNFYVRKSVEGNFGMITTNIKVERVSYTWDELEDLKKQPEYYPDEIDDMMYKNDVDKENGKTIKNYEVKSFDVLCAEYEVKVKEGDEEPTLCLFYFSEDRKKMIGACYYPYYSLPTQYNEMHIVKENPGFYQPGIADFTIDDNNVMDVILNLLLESYYAHTVMTPIVKRGSSTELQFLNRKAIHGLPVITDDGKPLQFFNEHMKPPDMLGSLSLMNFLKQNNDGKWGGSSHLTGREAPLDPTAPATKTLALLGEANKNIKIYILSALPSFSFDAQAILSIYYQITEEGRKFKKRPDKVVGKTEKDKGIFDEITRNELSARTNIQPQAYNFAVDKINEKRETMLVMQLLRNEALVAQDPEAVYTLVKDTIKSISPQWRNRIDKILPSPKELQDKIAKRSAEGVAIYAQSLIEQSKATGQPPEIDPNQLMAVVGQLTKDVATFPSKEEVKAREKTAKEANNA